MPMGSPGGIVHDGDPRAGSAPGQGKDQGRSRSQVGRKRGAGLGQGCSCGGSDGPSCGRWSSRRQLRDSSTRGSGGTASTAGLSSSRPLPVGGGPGAEAAGAAWTSASTWRSHRSESASPSSPKSSSPCRGVGAAHGMRDGAAGRSQWGHPTALRSQGSGPQ